MLYNQFFRSRRLLLLISLAILLIIATRFYLNPSINISENSNVRSFDQTIKEEKINKKVVEINDRQPAFKLYIYDGYEVASDRNRAQAKLLDNLKLHDKCQQNPKTIVIDVGASLGIIIY